MSGIGNTKSTGASGYTLDFGDDAVTQVVGQATAGAQAVQQLATDFNVPAEPIAAAVNKISAGTHANPPDAAEIESGREDLLTALTTPSGKDPASSGCPSCSDSHGAGADGGQGSGSPGGSGSPAATSPGNAGNSTPAGSPHDGGAQDAGGAPPTSPSPGAGGSGGTNYDAIAASQPPGQAVSKGELLDRTRQALIAAGLDPSIVERILAMMEQWLDSPAPAPTSTDTTAPVDAAGSPSSTGDGGGSGSGGSGSGGHGSEGAPSGSPGASGITVPTASPAALHSSNGVAPSATPAGSPPAVKSLDDAAAGYGKTWTAKPMTTEEIQAFGREHAGEPPTQANIEKWAQEISQKTGIPVQLLIADMANESSGNPNAVGDVGAENGVSLGLFQVRENFMDNNGWSTTFPFKIDSQTYKGNAAYQLATGGSVLAYRMQDTGGVKQAFAQHLTGSTDMSPARVQEYLGNLDKHISTYNSGGDALTAAS
jgi:hypothetical protein